MIYSWIQGSSLSVSVTGALVGAVVGLIGVVIGQYLTQRRHSESLRKTAELEAQRARQTAELEEQRADRDALLKYCELVGQLVSDPSRSDSLMPVIQAQTMTLLEALEPGHKRILLHFLYELNLIGPEKSALSLRGADLSEANLANTDGRRVNLAEANLADGDARRANLSEANLEGTHFERANLEEANLRNANLRNANLRDANLKQADLSGAVLHETTEESLTQTQIDEAVGNEATKLPDHLQRPAHWSSSGQSEES